MIEGLLYHLEPDKTCYQRVTGRECLMRPMQVHSGDICVMQKFMVSSPNTTGGLGCKETSPTGAVLAWFVHPVGLVMP